MPGSFVFAAALQCTQDDGVGEETDPLLDRLIIIALLAECLRYAKMKNSKENFKVGVLPTLPMVTYPHVACDAGGRRVSRPASQNRDSSLKEFMAPGISIPVV